MAQQHGAVRADRSSDQRLLQEVSQDGQSSIPGTHLHTCTLQSYDQRYVDSSSPLSLSLVLSCWWQRSTGGWWWSTSARWWEDESSAPLWRWGRGWLGGSETKENRSKCSSKTWSVWDTSEFLFLVWASVVHNSMKVNVWHVSVGQESPSSWLDSALSHISEIIQLEDVPSIQMEVGVLVREFPDVRYKDSSSSLADHSVLTLEGQKVLQPKQPHRLPVPAVPTSVPTVPTSDSC